MASDDVQMVVFSLNVEGSTYDYGVPILQVQGIERLPDITKLPQAESFIEGIINLRNEIIPLVDLKKLFALGEIERSDETRIIIFDVDDRKVGVIVDDVQEVIHVGQEQIESNIGINIGVSSRYIKGVAKVEDKLIIIIDLSKIFTSEQKEALETVDK